MEKDRESYDKTVRENEDGEDTVADILTSSGEMDDDNGDSAGEKNSSETSEVPFFSDREREEMDDKEIDFEGVLDVCNKTWSFPLFEGLNGAENARHLYLYNNVFTVIPSSVSNLEKLRTLKVFSNEVNLFPSEIGQLGKLEQLQVKISSSELQGLPPLQKLEGLKVLELHKSAPRLSGFTLSSHISGLRCLKRLSVCHFSISFLPSEIGCLKNLEELDLSFNKLRTLPSSVSELMALKSLRVASNKLTSLPHGLSNLTNLTALDASNNRLTSLQSLNLFSMTALKELDAQHNRIHEKLQIPSWMSCKLEGNENELVNLANEESAPHISKDILHTIPKVTSKFCFMNSSMGTTLTSRHSLPFRQCKLWKRQGCDSQQKADNQQHKARQERLNSSRKMRGDVSKENKIGESSMEPVSDSVMVRTSLTDDKIDSGISENSDIQRNFDCNDKEFSCPVHELSREFEGADSATRNNPKEVDSVHAENKSKERRCLAEDGSDNHCESDVKSTISDQNVVSPSSIDQNDTKSDISKNAQVDDICESTKSDHKIGKRHAMSMSSLKLKRTRCSEDLPRAAELYSCESFCGTDVYLPDGFYDAGRDQPFKPLLLFEKDNLCLDLDSREIILVDRERDEELDATVMSAKHLLSGLKRLKWNNDQSISEIDDFHRSTLLALFVSDYFGGSDKSAHISTMRRATIGANKGMPFVCSCLISSVPSEQNLQNNSVPGINALCKESLRLIKTRRNSNVVPLGSLHYGVCRHRAILLKYLCDRAEPPIPCELVRGYMDYMPHAWNIIPIHRDGEVVRMLFDACRPFDIREENDTEYFQRYIPLCRFVFPVSCEEHVATENSRISPCLHEEIGKGASGSVVRRCTLGTITAAAKVRRLETWNISKEQQRDFELNCLAEVRMLSVFRGHRCIVDLYGHQFVSSWENSVHGTGKSQVFQFIIAMEYVRGGSLEQLLKKLAHEGKRFIPLKLGLFVAREIAYALKTIHSKAIIHRDIKSRNVVIDLDMKGLKKRPLVKLCDFDRAIPLHSSVHECCLAHHGVPRIDVCVGTPRWMAPEMVHAIHRPGRYGLEVDIWSFGCLILELLTLEIPFQGLSDDEIYHTLQMKKGPQLSPHIEELLSEANDNMKNEGDIKEDDLRILKLLVDLFHACTEPNPLNRPTASQAYEMLCAVSTPLSGILPLESAACT